MKRIIITIMAIMLMAGVSFAEEATAPKQMLAGSKTAYDSWFEAEFDRHIGEIGELVKFPTVASQPENAKSLEPAAQWLVERLTAIGMESAKIHPAEGYPIVTAEWLHAKEQPTVLIYGHFDVQPADPEKWDTPPFEATVKGDRLYGRGATDDKGMIIAVISAIEAMLKADGTLPVNVKLMFEGQEEYGSPTLLKWINDNSEWLGADYGYSADAMMQSDDQGLLWRGLKGGCFVEITLKGANDQVHSGIYGGIIPNTAAGLSQILASLHNPDGTVAVKGFYNNVDELTEAERAEIAALPWDGDALAKSFGLDGLIGEPGYSPQEIRFLRPTLEITGINSGIHGTGGVIPNEAKAWITSRLVTSQKPSEIIAAIKSHVEQRVPKGFRVEITGKPITPAVKYSDEDPAFQISKSVLTSLLGKSPQIGYVGGGVPALIYMRYLAGRDLVTFGFQREDENFHAPNEFLRLSSFKIAERGYVKLLQAHVDKPLRVPEPVILMNETGQFEKVRPKTGAGQMGY